MHRGERWVNFTLTIPVASNWMYLCPSTTCLTSHELTVLSFFKRDQVRQAFIDVAMPYQPWEYEYLTQSQTSTEESKSIKISL